MKAAQVEGAYAKLIRALADWQDCMPDPTLSDANLNRPVHNAYRIRLQGESQLSAPWRALDG